jgi:nucleotide-binding universal stress UspA family protein
MTIDTLTAVNEPADRIPRSHPPLTDDPSTGGARLGRAARVRVIVAFDGSPAGIGALALAALLAGAAGSELLVVCVFPPESAVRIPFDSRADRIAYGDHRMFVRQDAEAVLAEARAILSPDLAVTFRALECESVLRGLRQLVPSDGVDFLVLGATRRGPLGRLLHRSLAGGLVRDPPCAVTVVSHDPHNHLRSLPGQPERLDRRRWSASATLTRFTRDLRKRGI